MKKWIVLLCMWSYGLDAQESQFVRIQRANRRFNASTLRATANNEQAQQLLAQQAVNGDEQEYADKRASFGKSLKQLESGLIDPAAFNQLVIALQTGSSNNFLNIAMGTDPVQRRLVDPQASLAFILDGADNWINSMPAAPSLTSAESAGEMVELYWNVLLRDVPFNEYDTNMLAAMAVTDLNNVSDFKGPKVSGSVTTQTLFRGNMPGDLVGPFVSQFLYVAVPYGPAANFDGGVSGTPGIDFQAQTVPTAGTANDFMTSFDEWHFIQKGNNSTRTIDFITTRTFIRNERDLGDYVHHDFPEQPYFNAALIILNFGADALDKNNPYLNNPTQEEFTTYGVADILYLLSVAVQNALKTAWYQKWQVHRRLRPEFFGFLINQQITGALASDIHSDVINSTAAARIFSTYGSYFLPQAYPEGSPAHPSYPAGHATVAGACATILKAFFNEDFIIPSPLQPNATNDSLEAYSGTPLTVGGELNKLAANISLGRDMAGVHYRSDGIEGLNLGEKVALALMEDEAFTRNINFNGFSVTKFDGTQITIGAKKNVQSL